MKNITHNFLKLFSLFVLHLDFVVIFFFYLVSLQASVDCCFLLKQVITLFLLKTVYRNRNQKNQYKAANMVTTWIFQYNRTQRSKDFYRQSWHA